MRKKHWIRLHAFLFCLLFCGLLAAAGCSDDRTSTPKEGEWLTALTADGRWLRDSQGRAVILRGINVGARSKLPPFLPFDDISYLDQLVDWGMNSIRLVFTWDGVEPEQGEYDEAYLDGLEAVLDGCAERRIMAILDSHQDIYARNFCGDGFPGWTVHPDYQDDQCPGDNPLWSLEYILSPGVKKSFERFWADEDLKNAYIAMMVHTAGRLGGHPALAGIDLLNEPFDRSYLRFDGAFEREVLMPFYRDLATALRQSLPDLPIAYNATCLFSVGFPTYLDQMGLPNVIFGAHWYDLLALLIGNNPDIGRLRARLEEMLAFAEGWQVPVWVGEYGVTTEASGNLEFLSSQIDVIEEFMVGSAIWNYNPTDVVWNQEFSSLVNPGGSEKPHVSVFVRPYPARIAGTPLSFRFDLETGIFSLAFLADSASAGSTEIVVPSRNYAAGFDVETDDGEWTWDPDRRRLLYDTPHDGEEHTLRLVPSG